MKISLLVLILSLSGCYALSNPNGAIQPVKPKDAKNNIYFTTCSGTVEDWPDCHAKAKATCKSNYEILEKAESPVGGKREITFQCH